MRYCLLKTRIKESVNIYYYITYCPGGMIIMKVTGMLVVSLSKGFKLQP